MQTFRIHRIDGEPFDLVCERFESKGGEFLLYDAANQECSDGFLCFKDIAAIVPEEQDLKEGPPFYPICFSVYLRDKEPIDVWAHAFDLKQESGMVFLGRHRDITGQVMEQWAIKEIYIAVPELVAIIPKAGLIHRR